MEISEFRNWQTSTQPKFYIVRFYLQADKVELKNNLSKQLHENCFGTLE